MTTADALPWEGEADRLDRVLPALGLARSRSQAAELITSGAVRVDGCTARKSGQRILPGERIAVAGGDHYVSRAAHKLRAGLNVFGIDPAGAVALDLGASTGGFSQVLLERGARTVLAIDVGHDQMATEIRDDQRVRLVEGCNARSLTADELARLTGIAERPTLVVADLSFISLRLILPAIAETAAPSADLMLLIKPQFEVGRTGIKEGIVVSAERRADGIRSVLTAAAHVGYGARGLEVSPLAGGSGNREYLVHFQREAAPNPTEWEGRLMTLSGASPTTAQPHTQPHTQQNPKGDI